MSPESPFEVLGLAPTLDLAAVKRAYFQELAKHPPHQDPQGFRRLRSAYETLMQPSGLASAFLSSPFDAAAMLKAWEARVGEELQSARAAAVAHAEHSVRADAFVETLSRMKWADAVKLG